MLAERGRSAPRAGTRASARAGYESPAGVAGDCGVGAVDPTGPTGPAFTAGASAGRTVGTDRYRATLVLGQPALGAAGTGRFRALVGTNPALSRHHEHRPETP